MNANLKPFAAALTAAALLGIAPAHAESVAQPDAAPGQAQGAPAVPPGMGGMMGPAAMGKPAAGASRMPGQMSMMGMMQMCPMMHRMMGMQGMIGMHGAGMAAGTGLMMGYRGLVLSDAQADKLAGIQKALFRKESALMQKMYDARLDAERDAYAVLSKTQREQYGRNANMMGQ